MELNIILLKRFIYLKKIFLNNHSNKTIFDPNVYKPYTLSYLLSFNKKKLFKKFLFRKALKRKIRFFSKLINTGRYMLIFQFFNKFVFNFLEVFLRSKIFFNLKKSNGNRAIRKLSSKNILNKYFRRSIRVGLEIFGVIYYSFLLKDATIFVVFLKKILERINLKMHKKILIGLRKLIKAFFKPFFKYLNLLGLFFNIKGKLGVTGNAKKRRYYFYFGRHNLTTRNLKMDVKYTPVWTPTGTLGFTFYLFF